VNQITECKKGATQRIEQDIINTLKEMIEALKKARQQLEGEKKQWQVARKMDNIGRRLELRRIAKRLSKRQWDSLLHVRGEEGRSRSDSRKGTWVDRKQKQVTVLGRASCVALGNESSGCPPLMDRGSMFTASNLILLPRSAEMADP
jgi:hypothetical protein